MTSVQVAVRVRPFSPKEEREKCKRIIDMEGVTTVITDPSFFDRIEDMDALTIEDTQHIWKKNFTFDHSFWSFKSTDDHFASQETVFEKVGQFVIENTLNAFNCSVFAYGQTGSGKSYSMMGTGGEMTKDIMDDRQLGLIPRICRALFDRTLRSDREASHSKCGVDLSKPSGGVPSADVPDLKWTFKVTYLEIYRERVYDLFEKPRSGAEFSSLRVREHPIKGAYAEGLTERVVKSYADIQTCIIEGSKARTVASTNMNLESSRSHAVFTLIIKSASTEKGVRTESRVQLVDLAGSERAKKSGATGERLKEGSDINKSLSALSEVIKALATASEHKQRRRDVDTCGAETTAGISEADCDGKDFIPYRNSTLTWLLKESLGGNAKTVMLATLSPADYHYEETMSTLKYVERAKKIVANVSQNHILTSGEQISQLKNEVAMLKSQLASTNGGMGVSGNYSVLIQEITETKEKLKALRKKYESDLALKAKAYKQTIVKIREKHEQEETETRAMFLEKMATIQTAHEKEISGMNDLVSKLLIEKQLLKSEMTALKATKEQLAKDIILVKSNHDIALQKVDDLAKDHHQETVQNDQPARSKCAAELHDVSGEGRLEKTIGPSPKTDRSGQEHELVENNALLKSKIDLLEGALVKARQETLVAVQASEGESRERLFELNERLNKEHATVLSKVQEDMNNTLMGTVSTMRQEFTGEIEDAKEQGNRAVQLAYAEASSRLEKERAEHTKSEDMLNDTIGALSGKVKELLNKLVDAERRHEEQIASWEERLLSAQMQTAQAMNFQVAVARGEKDISWVTQATQIVSKGIKRYTGQEEEEL
jgi:kinesin family protein 16B